MYILISEFFASPFKRIPAYYFAQILKNQPDHKGDPLRVLGFFYSRCQNVKVLSTHVFNIKMRGEMSETRIKPQ